MTIFPFPWDATFDSEPADNENINLGAERIRDTKSAVQLRMRVDHSWNGDANDGLHVKSEYIVQSTDPVLSNTDGAVYTKSVGGNTELFYEDNTGHFIQLTSLGQLQSAFPAGTRMTFLQVAPPPGWLQITAFNDQMVRLVSDASGGGSGGSWPITGLTGVTDFHTLTVSELPQHTHNVSGLTITPMIGQAGSGFAVNQTAITTLMTDGGTGGGMGHQHTISPSDITGDGTWRPAYVNMCVGQKT